MGARAFANAIVPNHPGRELVLTLPLPEDRGLKGDGRPGVRRFRSLLLALGPRLRAFREEHDLTQAEVARALGLGDRSALTGWEKGATVPDGLARERLVALLDSRLWRDLRRAMVLGVVEGMPERWERAVRRYRRLSRERRHREGEGQVIAAALAPLREVADAEALRRRYSESDEDWDEGALGRPSAPSSRQSGRYRAEDAAYGLRWLEITGGMLLDPRRPLVSQIPASALGRIASAVGADDKAAGGLA